MKKILQSIVLCGAAILTMTLASGCGDDDPVTPPVNGGDTTTYVKFAQGDTFTYDRYNRDSANVKQTNSKNVVVWTVLNTNQTIGGRSNVTVIAEQVYEADGVTATAERDTLYMQSGTDGKLYQYNLLRSVIKRIPSAEAFLDSVPPNWIQISNTKSTTASSWVSLEGGTLTRTVTLLGFPAEITFTMNATHAGKQSITVPSGTYATSVHTDHNVGISIVSQFLTARDTLALSYDVSPKDGIVHQSLASKQTNLGQPVPGFDLELRSVVRKP